MWYLVLSGTFAAWVLLDGISRNSWRAAVAWAIGTLFLGPIFLPIYMARRPLKKGEVREGGTAWNALKYFAILWTIVMAVASFSALTAVGRHVTSLRSDAERAGAGLGMIFGIGLLAALWFIPTLGAALLGFFLKKNTAFEAGPTGPLVGTDSTAGFANGLMGLMASAVVAVILIGILERIESSQRGTVSAVGKSGELRLNRQIKAITGGS